MDYEPLWAKDYIFSPFVTKKDGDSRALRLATSKADPNAQYIVKCIYPEDACNEFMYHHTATALAVNEQYRKL